MSIRIVADSSADITNLPDIPFAYAPLKIITADREYVDNENLDILEMVTELQVYKGKSSTSCPNVGDWLTAFGDADEIICITITATLSGSYNAAMMAKQTYEESNPGRRVFVLNSLSAGPEIALIVEEARRLTLKGESFDFICDKLTEYYSETGLLFMLESLTNFANNGRVSPLVARMAAGLGVRIVGKASDKGDLEPLHKCRGEAKALRMIVRELKEGGLCDGHVRIAHCFNDDAANKLAKLINKEFPLAITEVHPLRGLCSFYAEMGGLLIGFEKH